MNRNELICKAIWPTTLITVVFVGANGVNKVSQDAVTVSQNAVTVSQNAATASQNALKASENAVVVADTAKKVADTAAQAGQTVAQTLNAAPQIVGESAHNAGEEVVRGLANGAVQVGASIALAPVSVPALVVTKVLPEPDRRKIEQILDPTKWKIF